MRQRPICKLYAFVSERIVLFNQCCHDNGEVRCADPFAGALMEMK